MLASVSQQVRAAQAIQERTFANWVALNRIAELRLSNETPEVSDSEDEVRFADIDWLVTTTISETGVEKLFRIDVDVAYAGSEDVIRTVTGFIGEPGIPGQANIAWTRAEQAAGEEK
jgi:general secretion pathway protein I